MKELYGCRLLTDRKEIGKAMNFGKYPVLWMEVGKTKTGWEDGTVYDGCKANVVSHTVNHGDLIYTGELIMFADEQNESVRGFPQFWDNIKLKNYGSCLKSDFGYSDVIEDLENAQAPMLKPNQDVVVVFKDSVNKACWVRKMVTSDRIDPHCYTMMTIRNPK